MLSSSAAGCYRISDIFDRHVGGGFWRKTTRTVFGELGTLRVFRPYFIIDHHVRACVCVVYVNATSPLLLPGGKCHTDGTPFPILIPPSSGAKRILMTVTNDDKRRPLEADAARAATWFSRKEKPRRRFARAPEKGFNLVVPACGDRFLFKWVFPLPPVALAVSGTGIFGWKQTVALLRSVWVSFLKKEFGAVSGGWIEFPNIV